MSTTTDTTPETLPLHTSANTLVLVAEGVFDRHVIEGAEDVGDEAYLACRCGDRTPNGGGFEVHLKRVLRAQLGAAARITLAAVEAEADARGRAAGRDEYAERTL